MLVALRMVVFSMASPAHLLAAADEMSGTAALILVFVLSGLCLLVSCFWRKAHVPLAAAGCGVFVLIAGQCMGPSFYAGTNPDRWGFNPFLMLLWYAYWGSSALLLLACVIALIVGMVRFTRSPEAPLENPVVCPKCGCRPGEPGASHCPNCGAPISSGSLT
jgi:hypothetical protein